MGRKPEELHPYLLANFEKSAKEYAELYPDAPQPFLTETHRKREEQTALYAQGRKTVAEVNALRQKAGMGVITKAQNTRVTNATADQSLHCYLPALAYDIAFKTKQGKIDWDLKHFKNYAAIATKDPSVEWGGAWRSFKDNPHFQFKAYTWQMAQAGIDPLNRERKA